MIVSANSTFKKIQQLAAVLQSQRLYLATAESCTGGGVAQALTAIPGSSMWFSHSVVSYSNAAKQQLLQVNEASLQRYGAVSETVAAEMVQGLLSTGLARVGLAITGTAGPGGGSVEKPVGTVCFAWCYTNHWQHTEQRWFDGDRVAVREQSIEYVLARLLDYL